MRQSWTWGIIISCYIVVAIVIAGMVFTLFQSQFAHRVPATKPSANEQKPSQLVINNHGVPDQSEDENQPIEEPEATTIPVTPESNSSWPLYKSGNTGETVRSIQYFLRQHKQTLSPDGEFGSETIAAVKKFQTAQKLLSDGVMSAETWQKLIIVTRDGGSGDAVTALQRQLNYHGAKLTIDGDFGPLTQAAVKTFQQQHSLKNDGIASLETWQQLVTVTGSSEQYDVVRQPTITADFMNQVLAHYNSPAQGKGQSLYNYGVQYGIDPVFALAFFRHESSFGKTGRATTNYSLGNSRCSATTEYYVCNNGFRKYSNWEAGFEDWYRLIRDKYVQLRQIQTIDQILQVYAPPSENDTAGYIRAVKTYVDAWRNGQIG